MIQSFFVAGTDTGVGKTLVTALLALRLRQMGVDCGVLKPFASGCTLENGTLISEDATFLRETLQLEDSHDEICPIRLEEPLAPLVAARRAGISTAEWPEVARAAYESLKARHECIVVEGVGGMLAPIWEDTAPRTNLDLINAWGLPTVLVARRALGTINHTLLTLNLALEEPAAFAGLIFNDAAELKTDDVAALTSPEFIAENCAVPVWGTLAWAKDLERATLQQLARKIEIKL